MRRRGLRPRPNLRHFREVRSPETLSACIPPVPLSAHVTRFTGLSVGIVLFFAEGNREWAGWLQARLEAGGLHGGCWVRLWASSPARFERYRDEVCSSRRDCHAHVSGSECDCRRRSNDCRVASKRMEHDAAQSAAVFAISFLSDSGTHFAVCKRAARALDSSTGVEATKPCWPMDCVSGLRLASLARRGVCDVAAGDVAALCLRSDRAGADCGWPGTSRRLDCEPTHG